MSLTLEVPELGRAKPNFEFLLAGLGQAGPASLKTRNYFASVLFFLSEERNAAGFLIKENPSVGVLVEIQMDSLELSIKMQYKTLHFMMF